MSKFSVALSTSALMTIAVFPLVPAELLSPNAILYADKLFENDPPVALNLIEPPDTEPSNDISVDEPVLVTCDVDANPVELLCTIVTFCAVIMSFTSSRDTM